MYIILFAVAAVYVYSACVRGYKLYRLVSTGQPLRPNPRQPPRRTYRIELMCYIPGFIVSAAIATVCTLAGMRYL